MIIDYLAMLQEFTTKYNHYDWNEDIDNMRAPYDIGELRYKLIFEEVNEELLPILKKLWKDKGKYDNREYLSLTVNLADAIADSLYVIFGTCIAYGIPIDEIFNEVHRSNMTKSTKKNEYGKTIKGKDYVKPNLEPIIRKVLGL